MTGNEVKIKACISEIKDALKQDNKTQITKTLLHFGMLLQEIYPGKRLEKMYKEIKEYDLNEFKSDELPNLTFIAVLSEARTAISMARIENASKNDIYKWDALLKGLNTFGSVVDNDGNIEHKLIHIAENITENDIQLAMVHIDQAEYHIPQVVLYHERITLLAPQTIQGIENIILPTLKHLETKIRKAVSHNRELHNLYFDLNGNIHLPKEINANQTTEIPEELKLNLLNFYVLKRLKDTLNTRKEPIEQLKDFYQVFTDQNTQNILSKNTDSNVTQFFKKAAYIIANILTLGGVYLFAQTKPIQSINQRMFEDLKGKVKQIKNAENNDPEPSSNPSN